jgi:hypothetical protein
VSELRTAEELAGEWIVLHADAPEVSMVLALLDRIDHLRDSLRATDAAKREVEFELSDLRYDMRKEVDHLVAVRLHEVRSSTSALLQAASDFAVAVDEEWR